MQGEGDVCCFLFTPVETINFCTDGPHLNLPPPPPPPLPPRILWMINDELLIIQILQQWILKGKVRQKGELARRRWEEALLLGERACRLCWRHSAPYRSTAPGPECSSSDRSQPGLETNLGWSMVSLRAGYTKSILLLSFMLHKALEASTEVDKNVSNLTCYIASVF